MTMASNVPFGRFTISKIALAFTFVIFVVFSWGAATISVKAFGLRVTNVDSAIDL